ncbi:flagellar hook-basal body protein [Verrucomicrobia bacterium]|jgi:flagellar basal body rod protein FlgG|nr:flagellar hook-basal body protein [Verrucomicrobiota bacterium]
MNISIHQAASAMQAYEQWHATIADNMSAAGVPGFRKTVFTLKAEDTGLPAPMVSTDESVVSTNYLMPAGVSTVDHETRGFIKQTGIATDLALGVEGFFELQMDDGSTAYTRDGEFKLNELGDLVTKKDGYPLIGRNGPVNIDQDTGLDFDVAPNGSLSERGVDTGQQITAVTFDDMTQIQSIGGGIYVPVDPDDVAPVAVDSPNFQHKHLEQSNVSALEEMTRMIQVMRGHEANHRVIQQHDQRLGQLISELGKPI